MLNVIISETQVEEFECLLVESPLTRPNYKSDVVPNFAEH
jgi:hypothetical protein